MWRGVYRVVGHGDTWHQRALAAVLAGPDGTLLSHRAAAALHGFRGYTPGRIEVIGPRWQRARPGWVTAHESLRLEPVDTTVVDGIPATTEIRTLIDLGAVSHPEKIGRALDEERRRAVLTLEQVARRHRELAVQGRNGIRAVRDLIESRTDTPLASTGFEQLLLDLIRRYRLPEPAQQFKVVDGAFVAYLDFAYPENLLAIEADSEHYHLDLHAFTYDRTRQNRLSLLGWTFLRYTPTHLRDEPLSVVAQIRSALSG